MRKLLCPSMMCADFDCLIDEIRKLEAAGADMFHLDVMDGGFVPNFALGRQDVACIARNASIPVDAHLMIHNPGAHVRLFAELGAHIIYIHPEADAHAARTLQAIKDAGASPGIAVNPGTAAEAVRPLLTLTENVLVMTVNPGYAGQAYLPFVDEKIDDLLKMKEKYAFRIMIDGACTPEKIKTLSAKSVDGFVLGAVLFGEGKSYAEIMGGMRR